MPRLSFALVFTENPSAMDVLRVDKLTGPLEIGADVSFTWAESKVKTNTSTGKILQIGKSSEKE